MKLDRIRRIRGHRLFNDFAWPADLESFGRFNLIYGWNGSGKTTLSNIMRALQLRTAVDDGEVSYEIDGNIIPGNGLAAATLPEVRVFNRDTITRSVFETPGTSQLPPVFVFGEDSVELQRQVEDLKGKLPALQEAANKADIAAGDAERRVTAFATAKAREIKNLLLAPGSAYNNYNVGDFRDRVKALGDSTPFLLGEGERKRLLDLKGSMPKETVVLPDIPFPDLAVLHSEVQEILQRTVVSAVVADLAGDPAIASWVQQGLRLHSHDGDAETCKFCLQPLLPERLRALEAHFNDRFNAFARDIDRLQDRIDQAAKTLDGLTFPSQKLLYSDLEATYVSELGSLKTSLRSVGQGLKELVHAVRAKKDRMFEPLVLADLLLGGSGTSGEDMSFVKIMLAVVVAGGPKFAEFMGKTALARLESIVKRHNDRTTAFQDEVTAARQKLYDHEIAVAAPEWRELAAANAAAATLKKGCAEKVTDTQRRIRELEADVLQHRPMAEKLNQDLITYLGHDEIQVVPEKTGYQLMRRGVPAANLSEGERTAIAFLHFLRSLNDRSFDLATGIVVVDDPISSLDSNSTYTAFGFLKEKLKDANQLFVLTHNFTFFRQVRNWFNYLNDRKPYRPGQAARFFMLRAGIRAGVRCAQLESLDKFLREYESEYHYLFKRVHEASALSLGQPLANYYDLPNLARRLLETFLIFKVPNKGSLHSRLQEVPFPEPRKTRLLRFVDTHSHAEHVGEGHEDAAALAEAPTILRDLLDLIACVDADHYTRMQAALARVT
ncbi:AAA family ATPase [Ralstonia pseudosolanacearum]|uniref:AAA family ATPase n=1 Tax=Ralstonia pseudosolanacearum TaxID=1310165 RepID=UPI000DAD2E80|nr:AAA family ATPase [Ralstonia pseudosolanacearum]MCK4152689.1 AAA family ATPase [Ralstonia pseudosolanacearum]RAA10903.1 hypothetical protein DOT79_20680 [Ralstonia pseudosolanacearum]